MPPLPLLSIIIPLYNAAPFLETAVESIFSQNLPILKDSTEILIVNDGSTDDGGKIARQLAALYSQITCIEQENRGVACARNVALQRASGDIICFLDADDVYLDGAIAFFLAELESLRQQFGDLVMVRGRMQYLQQSQPSGDWQTQMEPVALSVVTAGAQTRATVERIGFFDEELRGGSDLDWLLRAEEEGIVMPLREQVVMLYRQHESNLTRDVALMRAEKVKLLKKSILRKHTRRMQAKRNEIVP